MKKIISILACVCLLLSVMIVPIAAAETSATITFDDKAKRTTFNTSQQIWTEGGITVTNNKGSSTSNIADYANPARFYKSTELIIEYPCMTKIEFDTNTASYATALVNSITVGTVAVSSDKVTVVLDAPVDSYTIASLTGGQIRVDAITVYAEATAGGCAHEETTTTSNGDETHKVICDSCGETISTANCKDIDLDGACDTCEGDVALPETLTIAQAIALGSEQADSAYTTEKYLVTGQITAVGNTTYGNLYIADEEGNELYVYGLYSNDGSIRYDALESKPDEGDTVTVLSVVGNYKGTPQLKDVWLIEFTAGELEPTTPDPEADSTLTIEEAIALGESKKSNVYTEGKYYVTGTITEIYNESYGNMYIADENGNTLTVYGTYSADGSTSYNEMETKPVAGDTITVYGIIGNYSGAAQMKNAWIVEIASGEEETFEGTDPDAPIQLAVNESVPATMTEIKVPAEGTVFVQAADANGIFHVTSATGSYMLINGMANQATADAEYDLTLCGYEMVNIYNPGTETITLYVFLEAGAGEVVGTWDNPEVLELQENPWMPNFPPSAQAQTELAEGNQGHFYTITATDNGAFAISITAGDADWNNVGYQFNVTNLTTSWQSEFILRAADADNFYDTVMIPVNAGDELLINAGTYNPENVYSAPAGILNVNINFAAIGSYEYPVVLDETGAYTAVLSAGSQGYYYEYVVTEDGTVTVTMNDDSYHFQVNVVPADEEDWGAYIYGEPHTSSDDPAVASETVAVKAGDTVSIMVNTFNPDDPWNAPAGTVNWTLGFAEKVEEPVDAGKITVSDADAEIGKEFTVAIDISENPGIIGATLSVNYDANVLELISAEAGVFTNASDEVDEVVLSNYNFGPYGNNPFKITWIDALATENITTNGTFVTLTFRVKDDAIAGATEVSVTFEDDDIFDVNLENVAFEAVAGTVTITESTGMPGDANGDGNVNGRDYAMILQYLNDWDVEINLDNSDVNGDGNVNGRDYALLLQYLNDWDVELQ